MAENAENPLKALLQNLKRDEVLLDAEYAYHVTNCQAEEDATPPNFDRLRWHPVRVPGYDEALLGLPCVFFTTTLYSRGLPTTSPYPFDGVQDQSYWRVRVPLRYFEEYDMWRCTINAPTQKNLILTRPAERRCAEVLTDIEPLDKTNNPYLCNDNGRWRTNAWDSFPPRYFVNFVVFGDFPLTFCDGNCREDCRLHCSWDKVVRGSQDNAFHLSEPDLTAAVERRSRVYEVLRTCGVDV